MSCSKVLELMSRLRRALADVDVAGLPGSECAELVAALAATEKACAAARAMAGARAAASGAHRAQGFRDPADWMAAACGSSPGEARAALVTAEALDRCPLTRLALTAGDLSLDQAREITRTEAERPGNEADLLALATRSSLGALRDEARRGRFAAVDPEVLHERQQAARQVRHWRDDLGMVCGRFALPPEVGVPFVNRLEAETDRIRRKARLAGRTGPARYPEPREAHAADAFAALVGASAPSTNPGGKTSPAGNADHGAFANASGPAGAGAGGRRGRSADLVIVCDLGAWRRGHTHPGEPCHLIGGTPVPVAVAKQLAGDAFLKAVVHDGTRIHTVAHYGRHIPAEVRTALDLGPPPEFQGAACVEAGCGRRYGLEWDHVVPVANRGPTAYANLAARCWPHHHDKTDRDRAAGLLTGSRTGPGPDPP